MPEKWDETAIKWDETVIKSVGAASLSGELVMQSDDVLTLLLIANFSRKTDGMFLERTVGR